MGEEYLPFKIFSVALLTHMSNQCVIKDYYQITIYKKRVFQTFCHIWCNLLALTQYKRLACWKNKIDPVEHVNIRYLY